MSSKPQSIVHQAVRLTRKSGELISRLSIGSNRSRGSSCKSNNANDAFCSKEFETSSFATATSLSTSRHTPTVPRQLVISTSNEDTITSSNWVDADDDEAMLVGTDESSVDEPETTSPPKVQERGNSSVRHYGDYRTITQNDLFLESFSTDNVFSIIHFYQKESADTNERNISKKLDLHLQELSMKFPRCKFLRVDGTLAPFFTAKLQVKTLPTLVVLKNGNIVNRLSEFENVGLFLGIKEQWDRQFLEKWIREVTTQ